IQARGEAGLGFHFVQPLPVAEVGGNCAGGVISDHDDDQQGEETATPACSPLIAPPSRAHHCDCAPSTMSVTSLFSATWRPCASWGGWSSPSTVSPGPCHSIRF